MSAFRLNWRGPTVAKHVIGAAKRGVDDTMAAAVIEFKNNHPGWQNQTGTAEGSVRIIEPAHVDGLGVKGRWGSQGVDYFIYLEVLRGAALRAAASVTYPSLQRRIRQHLGRPF